MKEFKIRLADKDLKDLIKTYCLADYNSAVKFYFEEAYKEYEFVSLKATDSCSRSDAYLFTILGKQNKKV